MIKKAAKAPKTPTKKAAAPSTKPHALSKGVNFSKSFFNASLKPAEKIHFLREMLRIRRFEQQALKHYNQGNMGGFLHLYIGQESVAVCTASLDRRTVSCHEHAEKLLALQKKMADILDAIDRVERQSSGGKLA